MKSRTIYIAIFVLCLLLGGGVGYWYVNSGAGGDKSGARSPELGEVDTGESFPAGQAINSNKPSNNQQATSTPNSNTLIPIPANSFLRPQNLLNVRKIINGPVAGVTALTDTQGRTVLRYIEKETGHILDQPLDQKFPIKISDTTIPKVFSATFGARGQFLTLQTLKGNVNQIVTIFAEVRKTEQSTTTSPQAALGAVPVITSTVGAVDGVTLPASVRTAVAAPDKKSYLYLSEDASGARGIIIPGEKSKIVSSLATVFSSKLSEWVPQWPAKNLVTFTTRAGADLPGFMYTVDLQTKKKSLLLKNISGLTTLLSSGESYLLYMTGSNSGITTIIKDLKTDRETLSPLKTLSEKCVWSTQDANIIYCAVPSQLPSAAYPDDWYLGVIHLNDSLWKFNLKTGETTELATEDDTAPHDMTRLFLDEQEKNLCFIDKNDDSVWQLSIP